MEKILKVIYQQDPKFVLTVLVYLLLTGFLKWRLQPTLSTIWFLLGGLFGILFLDFAENLFSITPSPFKSTLFVALLAIVGLFIITSSGSLFASGLVLTTYFSLIWKSKENRTVFVLIFVLETFLFIR